jgi:hypothetical protein
LATSVSLAPGFNQVGAVANNGPMISINMFH